MIGEFYKVFSTELSPLLLAVFQELVDTDELPTSAKQGIITLIRKPNKDKLDLDNSRAICSLNNDAKLFTLIFAKRLKTGLHKIVDEEQSGFKQGRHISNNVRLVLDLVDYSYLIPDDSFILFIDFYKAFDTVERNFIFQVIGFSVWGNFF